MMFGASIDLLAMEVIPELLLKISKLMWPCAEEGL